MKATPEIWDPHATWWKQTFTGGADEEYEREILPLAARLVAGAGRLLDVGCGEGQVGRYLLGCAAARTVVGIDASANQLANATERGPAPELGPDGASPGAVFYVRGRAEELPFQSGSFDAAVCCLVIEHTEDPDAVLTEVSRVLAPGGRFLLLVNHPLFQGTGSGFVDDQILGEQYWRVGPYLVEDVAMEEVDSGVLLPFAHRPLSRYVNPLAVLDFLLVEMVEPPPRAELLAGSINPQLESAIPRLLAMLFEHRPRRAVRTRSKRG